MEQLRRFFRQWLGFSRTEVNGFVILLPLMIVIIVSEPVYRYYRSRIPIDRSSENKFLDSLVAIIEKDSLSSQAQELAKNFPNQLSAFDPNKITVSEMRVMGFKENLTTRIASYRQKGGVFRVKRDLMKMYGLDSTFYQQLEPYILLPETQEKKSVEKRETKISSQSFKKFDLNKADTTQLKAIKGIGSALSKRIIKFRDALGGFIKLEQIGEVYGLDSVVVNKVKKSSFIADNFEPVKLNLNTSDEITLDAHPYINKQIAKAIVAYRYQHGDFKSIEEIKKITILTPENAEKILRYLKVE